MYTIILIEFFFLSASRRISQQIFIFMVYLPFPTTKYISVIWTKFCFYIYSVQVHTEESIKETTIPWYRMILKDASFVATVSPFRFFFLFIYYE